MCFIFLLPHYSDMIMKHIKKSDLIKKIGKCDENFLSTARKRNCFNVSDYFVINVSCKTFCLIVNLTNTLEHTI